MQESTWDACSTNNGAENNESWQFSAVFQLFFLPFPPFKVPTHRQRN